MQSNKSIELRETETPQQHKEDRGFFMPFHLVVSSSLKLNLFLVQYFLMRIIIRLVMLCLC